MGWDSYTPSAGNYCKNIFLDKTRIVTKIRAADETSSADAHREYFYHGDHLQSATLITDYEGSVYERINYTPYGELWLEKSDNNGENYLPYRFTGKELDSETGLYYYGARYLDPRYSRWISTDPALGEYIPAAGKGTADEAGKLSGSGGAFNSVNLNLYHYAGNNPVKYIDPDGRKIVFSLNNKKKENQAAKNALIKIKQTPELAEMIDELERSPHVIKIEVVSGKTKNKTDVNEKGKEGGSGSTITWNYESRNGGIDDSGNRDRDPVAGLVHEFGHAESFSKGDYDMDLGDGKPDTTPSGEENALKRENQYRKYNKIELRSYYYRANSFKGKN